MVYRQSVTLSGMVFQLLRPDGLKLSIKPRWLMSLDGSTNTVCRQPEGKCVKFSRSLGPG